MKDTDAAERRQFLKMAVLSAGAGLWSETFFQRLAPADQKQPPAAATPIGRRELVKGLDGMSLVAEPGQNPFTGGHTAAAVMLAFVCLALLTDQGKLSPDDEIRKFVPEMPRYDPPITIRHLIRCENGLRDYWHLIQLAGWNIDDTWTDKDVLTLVTRQKARTFKPGSKFAYNSTGCFLLGCAIERITGLSLARFAEKNVFQPLGMTSTSTIKTFTSTWTPTLGRCEPSRRIHPPHSCGNA